MGMDLGIAWLQEVLSRGSNALAVDVAH